MDMPAPESDAQRLTETVLQVVTQLYEELHRAAGEAPKFEPNSRLESDLGLDSLARIELLLRLEQSLDIRLPDEALSQVVTIADLVSALQSARMADLRPRGPRLPVVSPRAIGARSQSVGTPANVATLNEVLEWHVERHPDAVQAVLLEGDRASPLTYAALHEGAQAVARGLGSGGVPPGATVALMLPTGFAYLEAFFGVLLIGAVPVPIYPPTSAAQLEEHVHRHASVLGNAGIDTLITVQEAQGVARALQARVPSLRHVWSVADLKSSGSLPGVGRAVASDSLAMLQYTSGSTGDPKGVMLTHSNLLSNIRALGGVLNVTASDVFVSWLPLYHDMGLIGAWLGSLYFGCLLVLMSPTAFLSRPERWLRAIHDYRGTLTGAPTFGYELCTRRLIDKDLTGLDLSSLRFAFCGAEPVYADTLERFSRRFAAYGFRAEALAPAYGLAEAAVDVTLPPVGRGLLVDCVDRTLIASTGEARPVMPDQLNPLRFVSCGPPLPGYQLRIVDASGSEVPERREGTLQFKGPSATVGYYRNPTATARLRCADWLDTGDRAYIAGGELYVTGRSKDIIIRRGQHVYPDELENAIGELEGVRKGCVVVFGSVVPGTATERLLVFAETPYKDQALRDRLTVLINDRVVACIGEPPEEVLLAPPYTVLKTSSGKLRRSATRIAYENGTLGRAPAAPAVQMLRLMLEEGRLRLRRWRQTGIQLAYGLYAVGVLAGFAAAVVVMSLLLPDRARVWRLNHRAARSLLRAVHIPFSVKTGTADLVAPHVIVVNHCSYSDSIFVGALLPSPQVFVAKTELQEAPVLNRYLRKLGTLFIERFEPAQSAAEVERIAAIARQTPVIVFPEGTFTRETGLRPFHLGAFQVAVAAGVPVIPIALRGTRLVLRDGQYLPRRMPVSAVVGPSLRAKPGEQPFAAVVRLRDEAREYILHNCGEPDLSLMSAAYMPPGENTYPTAAQEHPAAQ